MLEGPAFASFSGAGKMDFFHRLLIVILFGKGGENMSVPVLCLAFAPQRRFGREMADGRNFRPTWHKQ
jgi:hypothetical protein